jgi:hypothetical protein
MPAVHQSRAGRASKIEQALPVQALAGRFVNRPAIRNAVGMILRRGAPDA